MEKQKGQLRIKHTYIQAQSKREKVCGHNFCATTLVITQVWLTLWCWKNIRLINKTNRLSLRDERKFIDD